MAFLRYSNARVVSPHVTHVQWGKIRTAGLVTKVGGQLDENLVDRASELFDKQFNPNDFLLTHATIIASVDTYKPAGDMGKTGSFLMDGFRVNRKYADYRITQETQKYINSNCLVSGTPIVMADGTAKSIEDVVVGDDVITHMGRIRKVTETFCHEVHGNLYEIKVYGSNERLHVTKDHPFFVFRPNKQCAECGSPLKRSLQCISQLLGKHYCSKECYYKKRVTNKELLKKKHGVFVPVHDLQVGDFAAVPVVSEEIPVNLTLGQARLIGLFLAEGYYELDSRHDNEKVGAMWAFHEKETETLAHTVCSLMKSEFDVDCVIRHCTDTKGIMVTTKVNRQAAAFFSRWVLGEDSTSKYLCADLLRAQKPIQMEIMRGWFDGDGSAFSTGTEEIPIRDFRMTGCTSSRKMVSQLQIILHRLGISPRLAYVLSEGRQRTVIDGLVKVIPDPTKIQYSWVLSCGAGWISELVETTRFEESYNEVMSILGGVQEVPDLRFLNGFCIRMITSIEPYPYQGFVYNIETEEDHSYIAGGIAVHNSDSWSREVLLKAYPTFIGGHNFCFAPGTRVLLENGIYKAIEEIRVGDKVVTHKGVLQEVTHKFERQFLGNLQVICVDGFEHPLRVTGNHPFLVMENQTGNTWIPADKLQVGTLLAGTSSEIGAVNYRVLSNVEVSYEGLVYNLEVCDDNSYIVEPGVAVHNCEHVQVESLSKGRIIDAVARDIGDSVYVDILIATDRRHKDLIESIENGKTNTLSMGCSVDMTTCTKCGHVAADETTLCNHIKYEKGNTFFDEQGRSHRICEICGHQSIDPHGGVQFIEASWVAQPAFTGAVMRNIIQPTEDTVRLAQHILNTPPPQWTEDSRLKAARHEVVGSTGTDGNGNGNGETVVVGSSKFRTADMSSGGRHFTVTAAEMDPFMAGWNEEDSSGTEPEKPPVQPTPADPLTQVEDDLEKHLVDKVVKRVRDRLKDQAVEETLKPSSAETNENVVKEARTAKLAIRVYKAGLKALVKKSTNGADLLDSVAAFNQQAGIDIPVDVYRTALAVGPSSDHESIDSFLDKCSQCLGRCPDISESKTLVKLCKLLSQGQPLWKADSSGSPLNQGTRQAVRNKPDWRNVK